MDESIPHASKMRRGCGSWTAALKTWLDGEVLTHVSRDYIQIFFCVAQMRPDFVPDANKNDEDIFSDEEIDMDTVSLDALLRTHVGSTREAGNEAATDEVGETAHGQTTQEAINKSDAYWKPLETVQKMEPRVKKQRQMNRDYSEDVMKQLKKEISRSQQGGEQDLFTDMSTHSSCQKKTSVSGEVLQKWFSGLKPDAEQKNK